MTEKGKECGFPSNFNMPRLFASRKHGVTTNQIAEGPRLSLCRVRATNSLWGRDCTDLVEPSYENVALPIGQDVPQ